MSRDALPAPPPVRGTSAADDMEAYVRTQADERAARFVRTRHREPLVRCVRVDIEDRRTARTARAVARTAYADGWSVRVTYAYGWEMDENGYNKSRDIKVPTGQKTETGRKEMRKTGEEECPPAHSTRVVLIHPTSPGVIVVGYWKNEDFDAGLHHDDIGWHPIAGVTEFERTIEHNAPGEAHLF